MGLTLSAAPVAAELKYAQTKRTAFKLGNPIVSTYSVFYL